MVIIYVHFDLLTQTCVWDIRKSLKIYFCGDDSRDLAITSMLHINGTFLVYYTYVA